MKEGEVIADRYRLGRKLGEGGMGAVWAATHVVTRKQVAIKLLKPELVKSHGLVERFLREARAACAVEHPNVVQIHDVLQMADGVPLMVMDLLDGQSLAETLSFAGRMSVPELARVLVKVVPAIIAAHAAGVVHRDLKPDNLFLCRTADGSVDPRVLDFGIAKVSASDEENGVLTKTGAMLGTPFYMAPEQLFGEKDVDHRADIWSTGIIIYECLSGKRPTEADNLGQIIKIVTSTGIPPLEQAAPDVPPEICGLVAHMLTADRRARLTDLNVVVAMFQRYLAVPSGREKIAPATTNPGSAPSGVEAKPPPTGDTHWVGPADTHASAPPPARATRGAFVAKLVAVFVVGGLAAGIVVPLYLTSAAKKAALVSPTTTAAAVAAAEPATPPASVVSEVAAVDAAVPAPSAAPPLHANARPRPLPPAGSTSQGTAPPPNPTPSPQGVLVDKPPF